MELMPPMKENEEYYLSSVKNALRILRSFSTEESEKRVSQLAAELGIGKSTVSRLLSTLSSEGFVKKDPGTQKYSLGLTVLSLGGLVKKQLQLTRESRPSLMKLVKETGESAHLSILEKTEVVYVEQIESPHPLRILFHVGKRIPAFCTSTGRVLLSHQKKDLLDQIFENKLPHYTPKTITDPLQLQDILKKIKEQGYAITSEEFLPGVISIAAPIRNDLGEVVAAVSVVGPMKRIYNHHLDTYKSRVLQAAREISENLGY